MTKPTDSPKRFLNFPLVMLARTITDTEAALGAIALFAIAEYANHCQPDAEDALVQAMYCRSQRPGEALSRDVENLLARGDVDDLTEAIPEHFIGGGDTDSFVDNVRESIDMDGIELSPHEADALRRWCGLRRSAKYFNRTISDYDGIQRTHTREWKACRKHEAAHGALVWCSVPADYAFEVIDNPTSTALPMFRAVAACRSLIGRHSYTGTTKSMIRCRMIGAKSERAANELCEAHEEIGEEYSRLLRRRQFDNLLTDAAARGFITKVGMARRIYLSTQAQTPKELAAMVDAAKHRYRYREAERAAREALRQ